MQAVVLNVATFKQDEKYNSFQLQKSTLAAWMDMFKGGWFSDGSVLNHSPCVSGAAVAPVSATAAICSAGHSGPCSATWASLSTACLAQSLCSSHTAHPPAAPFSGVSCMSEICWDQSRQWPSDWSGEQQLCIPWPRALLLCSCKSQELPTLPGCCDGTRGGTGVKRADNYFLKKKTELLHFRKLCLRWFHKERRKPAIMHSFLKHPKGTAALLCVPDYPQCSNSAWISVLLWPNLLLGLHVK